MKTMRMNLGNESYNIYIGYGISDEAEKLINLDRKVIILTDTGVPKEYSESILNKCKDGKIVTIQMGEGAKNLDTVSYILEQMLDFNMTRSDVLVACGGGMAGDIGCFCASLYMRGIDFYNFPTTLLSAVDSSIGGKCGVNFKSVKNTVGAFYQPKAVVIDPAFLKTLDKRQINEGLAEVIKMSLTSDGELFSFFENNDVGEGDYERIIYSALDIKRKVVEEDEKETGIRKILNFGHTLGHGIEATCDGALYHGECVALGMIPMCGAGVRDRLIKVLEKTGLPTKLSFDLDKALSLVVHDKKCRADKIDIVVVDEVGKGRIQTVKTAEFSEIVKKALI